MLVIDASAAINAVLDLPAAEKISAYIREADRVLVPDLFPYEIGNAFWKYRRFNKMDQASYEQGIEKCLRIPDEYESGVNLVQEAFYMAGRSGLTVYDSTYLACALKHGAALVTVDKKLATVGKRQKIDVLSPV